jgi:2-alkenal reductase
LIKDGRVPTPGIGIVAASEAVATRLGVEGVVVVQSAPGSPAARAGIQGVDASTGRLGDIIVAVNGSPVRKLSDLTDAIEKVGVGNSVEITALRDRGKRTLHIEVADIGQP